MPDAPFKARLSDVASKAQVSIATASLALSEHPHVNEQTRQRVLEACRTLGYQPKSRNAPKKSAPRRFGFLVLGTQVNNETNAPILFHLAQAGLAQGIRFEYAATTRDMSPAMAWDNVRRFAYGLDGILLMGLIERPLVDRLRGLKIPHVVLGNVLCEQSDRALWATCIANDDQRMGAFATRSLIDQGHRRIAFVCEFMPHGLAHHRWLSGYRLTLMEAGLAVDSDLIQMTGQPEGGAGPAIEKLLKLPLPPTAFVVPDARIAGSLVAGLRNRGIEIGRHGLVFVGHSAMARSMGVAGFSRVAARADAMADLAILHLERLRVNPSLPPVHVLVPFDAFDFPGQPSGGHGWPLGSPAQDHI